MSKDKIAGIYKISSKIKPQRVYVGSSMDIEDRWRHHISDFRLGVHHSPQFQNHYDKYGIDDLIFEIIEDGVYLDYTHLWAREQGWYDRFKYKNNDLPYFNNEKIAGRPMLNGKHTDSAKLKISKKLKGKKKPPRTQESIQKQIKTSTGRKHSEETKRKMSESFKNRPPMSDETKRKIAIAHTKRVYNYPPGTSEEDKRKYRNRVRRRMIDDESFYIRNPRGKDNS